MLRQTYKISNESANYQIADFGFNGIDTLIVMSASSDRQWQNDECNGVFCALRCSGMGIAIGNQTGCDAAELLLKKI